MDGDGTLRARAGRPAEAPASTRAASADRAMPGRAPAEGVMARLRRRRASRRRRALAVSPLTLRILAVNMLALGLLLAGLLVLRSYQDRLIQNELASLTTEARIFAGALGEGAMVPSYDEFNEPSAEMSHELARQMVRRLVETTDTRTRLYSAKGTLVADSRILGGPKTRVQIEALPPLRDGNQLTEIGIDVYDYIVNRLPGREHLPLYQESAGGPADISDVQRALTGEIATNVWRSGRNPDRQDMLLTVAVPIQRYKQVLGAVYISRGGAEIDRAVRQFRWDILKAFGVALLVTVALSLYLAGTIARPIKRLAAAADAVRHSTGRQTVIPDFTHRRDEIGDLSHSLRAMTSAIWERMDAIERFAADVAHEIKNPLTSMRSAVETVQRVKDEKQLRRLLDIIAHDVERLDRLISDISNASRLDAELSRAEAAPVDMGRMLTTLADISEGTLERQAERAGEDAGPRAYVRVELPDHGDLVVPGLEGRLTQVFQNLIGNALSFSPPGGTVTLSARAFPDRVEAYCQDEGPGIPEGKLEAIFDRFYSERPAGEAFGKHSGLGLSISKQIVEAHNGRIFAENVQGPRGQVKGARFTVVLPRR